MNNNTLIFSCATYGKRSYFINIIIGRLYENKEFLDIKDKKVIINVTPEDYSKIDIDSIKKIDETIEIYQVPKNLYSFNKFYYTALRYINNNIVIFDDDKDLKYVPFNKFIENLNKGFILCGHGHPITNGNYDRSISFCESNENLYSNIIPIGCLLVFYPPGSLYRTLYHAKYISQITKQDDIYLRYCTKNIPVMVPVRTIDVTKGFKYIEEKELGLSYKGRNIPEIDKLLNKDLIFDDIIYNNIKNANDIDIIINYNNESDDLLKLTLRSIEKNLKFIKEVYLFSKEGYNIPSWIRNVKIIHKIKHSIYERSPRFIIIAANNIFINDLCEDDFYCGNFIRIDKNSDIIPQVKKNINLKTVRTVIPNIDSHKSIPTDYKFKTINTIDDLESNLDIIQVKNNNLLNIISQKYQLNNKSRYESLEN